MTYNSKRYSATMKDVAEQAGVSTATVSRALMNPEKVASVTRHKVQQAASQVGYISPLSLRQQKKIVTHTLLIIVPDSSDPACSRIIKGIETAALALQYRILIINTSPESDKNTSCFTHPVIHQVDGILLLGPELPTDFVITTGAIYPPVVIVNHFAPHSGLPAVHTDNLTAAFNAVSHLLTLGHRRIACLAGPQQLLHYRYRLQGYIQAMQRYSVEINPRYIARCDFSFYSGQEALRTLMALPVPPSALFCHSDNLALGVINEAKRLGIRIPEELSLMGFDNSESGEYSDPPLTTMASPYVDIGHYAVQLLVDQISGKRPASGSHLLEVELIIRGSTASINTI